VEKDDRTLLDRARAAQANAFAPYSNFRVGAAVRTAEHDIASGCNIENASYGLSMCAERVAIFLAIAHGARRIESLAVTTDAHPENSREMKMPCGACRQVMSQFMEPDAKIIVDQVGVFRLDELLPGPFKL